MRVNPIDECCGSVMTGPLDESEAEDLAAAFKVLADPARLRLLSLVAAATTGEACACDLVEPVGRSQPTVSHHLSAARRGRSVVTGEAGPLGVVPRGARPGSRRCDRCSLHELSEHRSGRVDAE